MKISPPLGHCNAVMQCLFCAPHNIIGGGARFSCFEIFLIYWGARGHFCPRAICIGGGRSPPSPPHNLHPCVALHNFLRTKERSDLEMYDSTDSLMLPDNNSSQQNFTALVPVRTGGGSVD